MLQIRMSIFNSLLLVGYYIAFIAFYFALKSDANLFRIGWALCLPPCFYHSEYTGYPFYRT